VRFASVLRMLAVVAVFALTGVAPSYAQSEVAPDHFDSPNTEPFPQPNSAKSTSAGAEAGQIISRGNFKLAYSLRCAATKLAPGDYELLLRSDGKVGHATLSRNGQTMEILGVVRPQDRAQGPSSLFIERIGNVRKLSAIYVAESHLVLDLNSPVENVLEKKAKRSERILLTATAPKNLPSPRSDSY
jgi:hypothetical protein